MASSRTAPFALLLLALVAAVLVATPERADAAFPGANGEVFFSSGGQILAVAPDGTSRVVREGFSGNVEVHPDGRTLALETRANGFELISIAGGPTQTLLPDAVEAGKPELSWSPDGSRFVVWRFLGNGAEFAIYDADGTNRRPLDVPQPPREFTWGTDGLLYTLQPTGVIDPATGQQTLITPQGYSITSSDRGIDVSPDATRLVTSCFLDNQPPLGLCVTDTAFNLQTFIPPPPGAGQAEYGHFSPDGTRIVFDTLTASDTIEGNDALGLWTVNVDGTDMRQLIGNVDVAEPPEWGRVPDVPPAPLEEPPPPPTNAPLECGGFDGDAVTTERADFADPVAYAVAVSQARFDCDGSDGADYVVLSRDDAFADSLVGAALTGDGPLLFTRTDSLPDATADEIQRLLDDGDPIYLLGGVAAISQGVEDLLTAFEVRRLAGPSRVETSVRVAEEVLALGGDSSTVAVARAGGPADNPTAAWADSVSAGAWTAAEAVPTVVTDTASVHPAVAAFLDSLDGLGRTVLLGGEAALSAAVAAAVPSPVRVAGDSRDATAEAIASELVGDPAEDGERRLVVINGYRADGWLFGLPAAGLAADAGAALALAQDPVPPATLRMACSPDDVDLLLAGSLGILTTAAADALDAAPSC